MEDKKRTRITGAIITIALLVVLGYGLHGYKFTETETETNKTSTSWGEGGFAVNNSLPEAQKSYAIQLGAIISAELDLEILMTEFIEDEGNPRLSVIYKNTLPSLIFESRVQGRLNSYKDIKLYQNWESVNTGNIDMYEIIYVHKDDESSFNSYYNYIIIIKYFPETEIAALIVEPMRV